MNSLFKLFHLKTLVNELLIDELMQNVIGQGQVFTSYLVSVIVESSRFF